MAAPPSQVQIEIALLAECIQFYASSARDREMDPAAGQGGNQTLEGA